MAYGSTWRIVACQVPVRMTWLVDWIPDPKSVHVLKFKTLQPTASSMSTVPRDGE